MRAIVVIPTFNERENLEELVTKIWQEDQSLHVLVVDDNSPDGTGKLADELSQRHPGKLFVLHRAEKEGLGRAYLSGFRLALSKKYELILQMDADFSHDPSYIPSLMNRIRECDLVLGSRYLKGVNVINWDLKRLILSKMASKYVQFITSMRFTDPTGGFKCWRRSALESIDLDRMFSNGYLFQIEATYKAFRKQLRIAEVPIVFYERNLGRSKMNWAIIFEALLGVIRLRLQ